MRWWLLVALVGGTGCDDLFNLEPITVRTADAGADASVDAAADVPQPCPADYMMQNAKSQYRLVSASVAFVVAAADCADDETSGASITSHTHLAVLSDASEAAYLYSFGSSRWIGLTDLTTPTTWRWVTSEPAMSTAATDTMLWATGEPNNPTTEHCGHFDSFHPNLVNNVICSESHPYVCECDAYANVPATYQ